MCIIRAQTCFIEADKWHMLPRRVFYAAVIVAQGVFHFAVMILMWQIEMVAAEWFFMFTPVFLGDA